MDLHLLRKGAFEVYWVDTGNADRDVLPWLVDLAEDDMRIARMIIAKIVYLSSEGPNRSRAIFRQLPGEVWEFPQRNTPVRVFFFMDEEGDAGKPEKIVLATAMKQNQKKKQTQFIDRAREFRSQYFEQKRTGELRFHKTNKSISTLFRML